MAFLMTGRLNLEGEGFHCQGLPAFSIRKYPGRKAWRSPCNVSMCQLRPSALNDHGCVGLQWIWFYTMDRTLNMFD